LGKVFVEGVTKNFGHKVAVDNLTFEAPDKGIVCLLGPSSAGKTTTLRMIAGLEVPDEGNIYIDDVLVNDLSPRDRDVALVFQSYALYPNKTVFENLAFPLKSHKTPEKEVKDKVQKAAAILRISHILDKLPALCSGGERQRVAIGRAIVREPKVYLFDEPLTNLDAVLRVEMRSEIKRLQKELEATTIYATPDQLEAMVIADKIAAMNEGKLVQYDVPDKLYDKPENLFVAGFIGSPPMNFIDCTLLEKNGKILLDAGDFTYDAAFFEKLVANRIDSEVILGIRPEHITVRREEFDKNDIRGEIRVIEPARPEMIIHVRVGETMLVAVTSIKERYAIGDKVWVQFQKANLHLFDRKTGDAIF